MHIARRSVFDTDGEFLLIEAADALPAWITPTNAENRVRPAVSCTWWPHCCPQVWIYQSHLHLVPLSHVSPSTSKSRRSRYFRTHDSDDEGAEEETAEYLSVPDAVRIVRGPDLHTLADNSVQHDAFRRIKGSAVQLIASLKC